MTHLASQLVGRDTELETLERLLERVGEGRSAFLLVSGEPGIGKTTLLAQLALRCRDRGFLVLDGRGAEFERGLPFSVMVDALDAYLESLDMRALERMAGDGLPVIAPVFPALRELADLAPSRVDQSDRFRAHHALRALIERLAVGRPLLLALDDLHWADNPSLELAAHLLRRPPAGAVLVAAAVRTGQVPAPLAAAVETAARSGEVEELGLGALDRAQADALMGPLEQRLRSRIYRESGGNPFYIEQLTRAGAGAGDATRPDGVPVAVMAAIRGELDGLSESARALIEAASVAGDPFEIDLATRVAGLDPAAAMAALDDLASRGLLRTTDVPRRFRFRHPLVRAAVYEGFAPGSRLIAHERAAAALAAQGAGAAARAHHVEASAAPGDLDAATVLEEAGGAVARLDPASAARWYAAALRLLPAGEEEGERQTRIELAFGSALAAAGQPNEAITTLTSVLDRLPPEPNPRWIEPTILCSTLEHMVGRAERARGWMLRALELGRSDAAARVRVIVHLAVVARYAGDYTAMRRWADEAAAVAEDLGDPLVSARALALRAYAASHSGDLDTAVADREHAAALVAGLHDEQLADDLDVLVMLASASYFLDRPLDARAESGRALVAVSALGRGEWWPVANLVAATAEHALGALERSVRMNDEVIDHARLAGDPQSLMWALSWRGRSAALQGDLATALSAGEECLELLPRVQTVGLTTWFAGNHAATLLAAGQPDRARETIVARAGPELNEIPAIDRARQCALLVDAALATGAGDAEEWCERAERAADSRALPISAAHACRARAAVLAAGAEHEAAAAAASSGIEAAETAGATIEAAQLRLAAGRALAATGDAAAAADQLEHAEDAFVACGATRLRQETSSELRRLGRGRHARARPGVRNADGMAALSEREREIAVLVRERHTNPQIAQRLFLSPKTVESHMRNIFRKLGVSSRVEVGQAVEREERRSG